MLLLKQMLGKLQPHAIQNEYLYYWIGLSPQGEFKSGHIIARTRHEARKKLYAQTLIIKKLSSMHGRRTLHASDITYWLQQLAKILRTGLSLPKALQILSSIQSHPKIGMLIHTIQKDLDSGMSFSESLTRQPRWFDPMLCSLIHLGEHTGTLSAILEKITLQRVKNQTIKKQFQTLMLYPLIVISMSSIVTVYMLITIVPQLQTFFQHAHQKLPWSTHLFLVMTDWLKKYGLFSISTGTLTMLYVKTAYPYFPVLQRILDRIIISIPGLKMVMHSLYLSRSFQAMTLSQQASLPLPDTLQWTAEAAGNYYYKRAFLQIRSALQHGESIHSALLRCQLFPELVVQMVSLGEESGTLPTLLNDLAHYYTHSLEDILQRLSRYVEPILMMILGVIIGGLMLCIYLPMIQLGAML